VIAIDDATGAFEAHRPRLQRLAYRMLGSSAEAEDIVQEAWLRWRSVDTDAIRQPAAWLTRTVTRLCLDTIKSARSRREAYIGNWLPEPIFEPGDRFAYGGSGHAKLAASSNETAGFRRLHERA